MTEDRWVYVIVQDPEGSEKFLGLQDTESEIQFIPAFSSKEEATAGMYRLPLKTDPKKREVQAIILEDILFYAKENGFAVFVLDGDGKVLERM